MKILNLQRTYLTDVMANLDTIKDQGFNAIQLDVLGYVEKNRIYYNDFTNAFDFGGKTLDVIDTFGTMDQLRTLCSEARNKDISIILKVKNTEYLGNAMHLMKKRLRLLLWCKENKYINLSEYTDESRRNFYKMLIDVQKENGVLELDEIFNLYRTSMFSNENVKELSSYLLNFSNMGVGGFVLDDTLSKKTVVEDRLRVFLGMIRGFSYTINHVSENVEEYYELDNSSEQINEAKNEESYDIARKLSEHTIFTPRHKDESDCWSPESSYRNPELEIGRFSDEFLYSETIKQINSRKSLTKTNY